MKTTNTRVIKLFRLNVCHFNSRTRSAQTQLRRADTRTYAGIIVTHAKYLGVVLDQHLSWNDHIKKAASKATKVIGFLQRNLYQWPSFS